MRRLGLFSGVVLGVALVAGACGRNKVSGEVTGSGGAGLGSGGDGTGGDGGSGPMDGGGDAATVPDCPFATLPSKTALLACATPNAQCRLPVSTGCYHCAGGSKLVTGQWPLPYGLCGCTTQQDGGATYWDCVANHMTTFPNPGSIGDCVIETNLTCDLAKGMFIDDNCTEPAPCTGGGGNGGTAATGGRGGSAGAANGGSSGVGGAGGAIPGCTFTYAAVSGSTRVACPTRNDVCTLAPFTECLQCIGGSKLLLPEERAQPFPLLCTCVPADIVNDVVTSTAWSCPDIRPKGDCHVDDNLTCAEAKNLFTDIACKEPAPCTP